MIKTRKNGNFIICIYFQIVKQFFFHFYVCTIDSLLQIKSDSDDEYKMRTIILYRLSFIGLFRLFTASWYSAFSIHWDPMCWRKRMSRDYSLIIDSNMFTYVRGMPCLPVIYYLSNITCNFLDNFDKAVNT